MIYYPYKNCDKNCIFDYSSSAWQNNMWHNIEETVAAMNEISNLGKKTFQHTFFIIFLMLFNPWST